MSTKINMQMHSSWVDWFINNESNGTGNRSFQAFSKILSSGVSNEAKLRALVEEIKTVILAADSNRNIMILHFPKNFGGARSRPENNVMCMLGIGPWATCVLLDLDTAFRDLQLVVPSVHDLAGCNSANEVTSIPKTQNQKRTALLVSKVQLFSFQVQFFGTQLLQQTQRILLSSFPSSHAQQRALTKSTSLKQLQ